MSRSLLKKTTLLLVLCGTILLPGCNSDGEKVQEKPLEKTTDNYRTMYQIFPYSFADSDKDGVGDIKGIINKLDYIDSLNYDGLWLTPIHKSPSYHKYDVIDYKTIDPKFGTLEDYDELVSKCHEKGMTILLDLVLNHSSEQSDWFEKCLLAHVLNQPENEKYAECNKYYNYYNVEKYETGMAIPAGWAKSSSYNLIYECQFWSGMPDLNLQECLDNPNGNLANDIKDILKFWLIDHDIDGFRLDAVTSYFTGDQAKNVEFLTLLNSWIKELKPNAYVVGEGSWASPTENQRYEGSGIDSFFNFEDAQTGGYISQAVIKHNASLLPKTITKNLETATETGIPAPFIANHDVGRQYGACYGSNVNNNKFGYLFLQLLNGTTFTYYGDEAGMTVIPGTNNKTPDENKRQPMPWGVNDSATCNPVIGSTAGTDEQKYPYGTVESQLKDKNSLVNFVAKVNKVRRQYPEIARGTINTIYTSDDKSVCVISKTYDGSTIYVALNASIYSKSYDYSTIGDLKIGASVISNGKLTKKGTTLQIPAQSAVILETNN